MATAPLSGLGSAMRSRKQGRHTWDRQGLGTGPPYSLVGGGGHIGRTRAAHNRNHSHMHNTPTRHMRHSATPRLADFAKPVRDRDVGRTHTMWVATAVGAHGAGAMSGLTTRARTATSATLVVRHIQTFGRTRTHHTTPPNVDQAGVMGVFSYAHAYTLHMHGPRRGVQA